MRISTINRFYFNISVNYESGYEWLKFHEDFIINKSNQKINIMQNTFGYLNTTAELNFKSSNIFFTSNPRNLLSFISEKFIYIYGIEYKRITLFEKQKNFDNDPLLVLAENTLIRIKNKRCHRYSLYPFELLYEFQLECDKFICTEITLDGRLFFVVNKKNIDVYSLTEKGLHRN